jgi:hypothetical protein
MIAREPHSRRTVLALLLIFLTFAGARGWAVDTINIAIAAQQGAGWKAAGIKARIVFGSDGGPSVLSIERLTLPQPIGSLHDVSIRCPKLEFTETTVACPTAKVHLPYPALDRPDFAASLSYNLHTRKLTVGANRVALAGGRIAFHLISEAGHWRLHGRGRKLGIEALLKLAAHVMSHPFKLTATGKADFELAMQGQASSPTRGSTSIDISGLTLNAAGGNTASDRLNAHVALTARATGHGVALNLHLAGRNGEAYINPIYLDLNAHPLTAALHGILMPNSQTLKLADWSINQNGVIAMRGSGSARLAPKFSIEKLRAVLTQAHFPDVYTVYAKPFLIGTPLDNLSTSGRLSGALTIQQDALHKVALKLDRVTIADNHHGLSLRGLTGHIHWRASGALAKAPRSTLAWRGGKLLHLHLGAARLAIKTAGNDFALAKPARLPLLDGALDIHKLRLNHLGTAKLNILFDATLLPISMPKLSHALGWPKLGGTLAGRLPSLSYRHGLLTLGGMLAADIFNGRVTVGHLRLHRPFSRLPTLSADVHMRRLNLKTMTHFFSVGEVQGLLNGDINNLRLVDWTPISFNARFYTPKNDPTNHVISQRAVKAISNLGGGGAGGALARSFISLFSNFSYDRIGLSCRLKDEICAMGGIAPAPNGGYYIVTGAGLPRVDVIGHSHAVSWPTLVSELKKAMQSQTPVVK